MEKVEEMLRGVFYIATVDGDQPRVRPFDSCVEYNGSIYFETSNDKKVYRQLLADPKIEIFAMGELGTLRLTGKVVLEDDLTAAKAVEDKIGKYLGDPRLAIFKISGATVVMTGSDGGVENLSF